jgi:hypothetical protein
MMFFLLFLLMSQFLLGLVVRFIFVGLYVLDFVLLDFIEIYQHVSELFRFLILQVL